MACADGGEVVSKLTKKVLLFATWPVWFPLALAGLLAAMPFLAIWMMVSELVDGPIGGDDWAGPR